MEMSLITHAEVSSVRSLLTKKLLTTCLKLILMLPKLKILSGCTESLDGILNIVMLLAIDKSSSFLFLQNLLLADLTSILLESM